MLLTAPQVALKTLVQEEELANYENVTLTVERRIRLSSVSTRYIPTRTLILTQRFSLLYGQPFIITNSTDEHFEWEELNANNQKLHAAASILNQSVRSQ